VSAATTYAVGQTVRVLVGLHAGKRAVVHELDGGGYWCRPDGVATPALYEADELEPAGPAAGAEVRVVATTLANGAPHPMLGRTGVVLEVRDIGPHPVRVSIGGRPVMFAAAELAPAVDGEITRDFP
jgi:hypothetical protein